MPTPQKLALAAFLAVSGPAAASATATAAGPQRVLVLDLQAVGVSEGEAALLRDVVASRLAREPKLQVISSSDVKKLMEVEATKELAGCDAANNACLAELAGALGAQFVVVGNVGKLGESVVFSISVVEGQKARALSRFSVTGAGLDDVLLKSGPEVDRLAALLAGASSAPDPLLLAGAIVAGAGAVASGIGVAWVGTLESTLGSPGAKPTDKQTALDQRVAALGTLGAGLVVAVAGGALVGVSLVE